MPVATSRTDQLEQFYNERFETGYMDEWPVWKKTRIATLLGELHLPGRGRAFDFGCGQGVFTDILRRSLPGWEVTGSDLSAVALTSARARFQECRFLPYGEVNRSGPYDLVFSHHVLEHVDDLAAVLARLAGLVRPGGAMVHVLPSGNAGSFEHQLARLRRDGVDPENGRFFLDEPGHLRRLKSTDLDSALRPFGFELVEARFANQYWGAIDWITDLELEGIQELLDRSAAVDAGARRRLAWLYAVLVATRLLKRPPALLFRGRAREVLAKRSWTWRDRALLITSNPAFAAAFPLRRWLLRRRMREWNQRRLEPTGSEMYLVFRRNAAPARSHTAGPLAT